MAAKMCLHTLHPILEGTQSCIHMQHVTQDFSTIAHNIRRSVQIFACSSDLFRNVQRISGLLHEEMYLLSCVADLYDSIGILDNQVNVLKKILSTFGQRTGGTRTELVQRRIMEIIKSSRVKT